MTDQVKTQLTNTISDLGAKIAVLTQNKTEMETVVAQIEASEVSAEEKAWATAQYSSASATNQRTLDRYIVAKERCESQLARLEDVAVKARVDAIMAWYEENGQNLIDEGIVSAVSLFQSSDDDLTRSEMLMSNAFLTTEQKIKMMTGRLIL